jgi:hypothetical protein
MSIQCSTELCTHMFTHGALLACTSRASALAGCAHLRFYWENVTHTALQLASSAQMAGGGQ